MCSRYNVEIGDFAESHYLKRFSKTYKQAWNQAMIAVIPFLEKIEIYHNIGKATIIHCNNEHCIFKCEFVIP
jgi:hypothetical protein